MKAIPALFAMAVTSMAASSDPGETAVHFLEKVRARNLNLAPGTDTALSEQTITRKRREIARRIDQMARDLGNDPLEVSSVKLDDDLAAVLVRKIGGFDPSRLQIFPIALIKRGADWTAAPVPASFENSGIGYASNLRARLQSLEEWMQRERVIDFEKLREQSEGRMRHTIEEQLPASTLAKLTPQQVAERFLQACEKHQLAEILGLIGGLAESLPSDWPLRVKSAESAVATGNGSIRPWRLLVAPEVTRVPVFQEEDVDTSQIAIACLDPAGNPPHSRTPRVEMLHLNLSKTSDGLWKIDPPNPAPVDDEESSADGDKGPDSKLLDMFPAKLSLKYPISPKDSAVLARDTLLSALDSDQPAAWIPLIHAQGDPAEARATYARASQIWWDLRDPTAGRRAVPLDFHEQGDLAVAACQVFEAKDPDRQNLSFLFFRKSPMGWLWEPAPSAEARKSLLEWTELQNSSWQEKWQETLLVNCPEIDKIAPGEPVPESDARKLAEDWLKAVHSGDIASALRLTARLNLPDSKTCLLRNLGFEVIGARKNQQAATVGKVLHSSIWTTVSTRTVSEGRESFPFYPIIHTASGPRILLEIDLLASRNRDFLNKSALDHLRKFDPEAAADLSKLFDQHRSDTTGSDKP